MRKIYIAVCLCGVLALTGCGSQQDAKLENADSVESVQEELGSVVLAGVENAGVITVYETGKTNGEVYELSNEDVKEFVDIIKDIHVMEKNADTSEAYKNNVTIKVYSESEYGWDEIGTLAESDNSLYLEEGWSDEGEYIYYKLRSEKLTEWIESIKKAASGSISEEVW